MTPQPGRGRRQIRSKAELIDKADAILTEHQVTDYLQYTFVKQQQVKVRYIGKGHGGPKRKKQQTRVTRYQMTAVVPNHAAINHAFARMGFKVYATNQSEGNLPLDEAVILYRAAPRIERHFHLFKSKPIGIQPMYVRDDDQIKGLIRLLSLCVRLLTLMEIVSRRHLAVLGEPLAGLYEGQPSRTAQNPTAKKLLGAFRGIHRVRATPSENSTLYTTPLTPLQQQILAMLSIDAAIYHPPTHKLSTLNVIGQRCGQVMAHIAHTFNRVLNAP